MNEPKISRPFFEIGPKLYLFGDDTVKLAKYSDELVDEYDVDILFTAQYTDIGPVAAATKRIKILAQHMDWHKPGRGLGAVLPESIKAAGAFGVMLNHAEHPLSLGALNKTLKRAKDLNLATIVCADTPEEGLAIAHLKPSIILIESPDAIGTGKRNNEDDANMNEAIKEIKNIDPCILVQIGAGIKDEKDVFKVILMGSDGTGSTSGILNAEDPFLMTKKMVEAVRKAWDIRNKRN